MSTCEMCGREILSRPISIEIEGAVLLVCPSCAKHGKQVTKPKPKKTGFSGIRTAPSPKSRTSTRQPTSKPYRGRPVVDSKELATDFHERIRLARQKKRMTQKEVSIQTKISVQELQSIETGKMRPPDTIIAKLESFFNIKITEEVVSYSPKDQKKGSASQTLGDIVVLKKKKKDEE
ncbi:MAG: multiprotein bridging factor aMBF1 [Candidatus Heimdallarchaeaceae archaeon]